MNIKFNTPRKHRGFTLIEIAVVLVIVGLLLGSFIGSLSQRIETTQRQNTKQQLDDIKTALLGFASAHGRLPCPTTTTGSGLEQPVGGSTTTVSCTLQHGFIPGKTLGIGGVYNRDNLLIDTWGAPIRYSVTIASTSLVNENAFTSASGSGGMKDITMADLAPDLNVCTGESSLPDSCSGGADATLISNAPFVVLSLGKDGNDFVAGLASSADQIENAGDTPVTANATGENLAYTVSDSNTFVRKDYSSVDSPAGLYDDLIIWTSPYILYSRMIEAGQLP